MERTKFRLGVVLLSTFTLLSACGGGGSTSDATTTSETDIEISGNAIKGPISDATIQMYYFAADGSKVDIVAINAPVKTQSSGAFNFKVRHSDVRNVKTPLIVQSIGGTMGDSLSVAPTLEAVLPDPEVLEHNNRLKIHLSLATSVAAGLLKSQARDLASAPTTEDGDRINEWVERELGIGLNDDPASPQALVAAINESVDQNLDLYANPSNNPLVNDLIEYFIANLQSSSGKLDHSMKMEDGTTGPAGFAPWPALNEQLPTGPEVLHFMTFDTSQIEIENDGLDYAALYVRLYNGFGAPTRDGEIIRFVMTNEKGELVVEEDRVYAEEPVVSRGDPRTLDGLAFVRFSSRIKGDFNVEATHQLPNGNLITRSIVMDVDDKVKDQTENDPPWVVASGSTNNRELLLTFNEPVRGGGRSAENPAFYRITRISERDEAEREIDQGESEKDENSARLGGVPVYYAELLPPSFTTVRLTTGAQSDTRYLVEVIHVRDLSGNLIGGGPDGGTSTTFAGVGPTAADLADNDDDGINDVDENLGWTVTVTDAGGLTSSYSVSSDQNLADTDGDGLSDQQEQLAGTDPRSPDTDGDTLPDRLELEEIYSDARNVDSDGDGLSDGFEYWTLRTSPLLEDTDGDQLLDPDEVLAGNRNPLISDLPSPRIDVSSSTMLLDVEFTYTDTEGKSQTETANVETTLTRSEDTKFSTSNENSTKNTLEASQEISASYGQNNGVPSWSVSGKVGSSQGSERGSTFTVSEESGRSSEEAYHESLTTSVQRDISREVTRKIVGADIRVDVSIQNENDVPFAISNLEVTAQAQDPTDRRKVIPIASLVPNNEDLDTINIGALGDPARGPFVFSAVEVIPAQIEELMKNPRGMIIKLANFDITDEEGRNFAFVSQEVLDRTAGLTFDLGDGRVEAYRVATASTHDEQGNPRGITMQYALDRILGLESNSTIRDGGDGIASTSASGDDVQEQAVGNLVAPGSVVVSAGPNGFIDSSLTNAGDDRLELSDYATGDQEQESTIRDGGNGIVDSQAVGDDIQLVTLGSPVVRGQVLITAGPDGVLDTTAMPDDRVVQANSFAVLARYRDIETNILTKRFWGVFSEKPIPQSDFGKIVLRSGDQFDFTYVQDRDGDDVWAREEFLYGSSDELENTDGCPGDDPSTPEVEGGCEPGTFDLLSDQFEIQEGWRVQIKKTTHARRVYPNPVQPDSDRDRLLDHEEANCLLDPRQRDTDLDGLTDWEELTGMLIDPETFMPIPMTSIDSAGIVNYTIQVYEGIGVLPLDENGVAIPGENLFPHAPINPDDFDVDLCSVDVDGSIITGFATDPLDPDTDGDLIQDGAELKLGLHPNLSSDGPSFLDDDGDGIPNLEERTPRTLVVNGANVNVTSDPNDADTDDDGLPDLLEKFLGSNPRERDTDGDGLLDNQEYAGETTCVTVDQNTICPDFLNANIPFDMDYASFIRACEAADACNYDEAVILSSSYGSSLTEDDSDFDGALDPVELRDPYTFLVNGINVTIDAPVSLARVKDTDGDLLEDGLEFLLQIDPNKADTDEDGVNDNLEINGTGILPNRKDRQVIARFTRFEAVDCDANDSDIELIKGVVEITGGTLISGNRTLKTFPSSGGISRDLGFSYLTIFNSAPTVVLLPNETVIAQVTGLVEDDGAGSGDDTIDNFTQPFKLLCDATGCRLDSTTGVETNLEDDANDVCLIINTAADFKIPLLMD